MTDTETYTDSQPPKPTGRLNWAITATGFVLAGLLFVLARQLGWTLGVTYMALYAAQSIISAGCILRWNPVIFKRRLNIHSEMKTWDFIWIVAIYVILFAVIVGAVYDLNTRGGDPGPLGIQWLIGAAIFVSGCMLITWSMVANPFFEKTVRIQTDHGHHVIDSGPYATIRHPGYVGFSAVFLSTPILLASTWILLPVLLAVLAIVIRTVLEDRMLQAELDGYAEYATRVRFRLIPGIW